MPPEHIFSGRPPKSLYEVQIKNDIVPVSQANRTIPPGIFEDSSFVVGESPATLDVNAKLGRNATEFAVQNDGPGDFTVSLKNTSGGAFGDEKTVKAGETYGLDSITVDSLRITHVADSGYRVVVI